VSGIHSLVLVATRLTSVHGHVHRRGGRLCHIPHDGAHRHGPGCLAG
jgi:hypothetical protein